MPSAFPGLAAAIPVLPAPAPVRPVGEDCRLAPRSCSRFCSWANAATQSCKVIALITTTLVHPIKGFIAVIGSIFPGFRELRHFHGSLYARYRGAEFTTRHRKFRLPTWYSGLASEKHRNTDASRVFFPSSGSVRAIRLSPDGVPTKVDLHVHCITPRSRPKTEIRAPNRATPGFSPRFTGDFHSFPPNCHHFPQRHPLFSRFENLTTNFVTSFLEYSPARPYHQDAL